MADTSIKVSHGQYLHAAADIRPHDSPLTPPALGEVQIAIRSTTLCGSDLHYYAQGRNGAITIREPLCLGHEAAGEIVALGSDADFKVGDRVALECGVPCDACDLCKEGRYNLCPKLRFRGSGSAWPHFQGTMQERVNHPARWVHKLPSSVTYDEGALLEPLAVAVHACRRANIKPGSSCLILGAGAVGLLCAVAARMEGCTRIAIADIVRGRVSFALEAGFADVGHVVEPKRGKSVEEQLSIAKDLASSVASLHWSDGSVVGKVDYTFECTGVESCIQASIYTTYSGGKALLVGMGTPNPILPISEASAREIELVPTWRYANCYPRAIEIIQAVHANLSLPQVSKMITHAFNGLETVPEALRTAGKTEDAEGRLVIKAVVNN